eukprot:CAMPEP_0178394660 /NCGR_PEP_ID=MMETSP0689_2-20121128/12821_1 /TAXON_ID=160604 /ORGANISM="Amphidinium massartii, Strain CS-259" /LENGTH=60 /DNA_ID=CAMNT_0020015297 /DNA_START=176 /DNA_END=358 /DNA_ORIENTATION=-
MHHKSMLRPEASRSSSMQEMEHVTAPETESLCERAASLGHKSAASERSQQEHIDLSYIRV